MNPTTLRRRLIPILIGVLSSLGAMTALGFLRQRRCVAAGDSWDAARGACLATDGTLHVDGLFGVWGVVAAAIMALVIAWVLWRVYTFPASRRPPSR